MCALLIDLVFKASEGTDASVSMSSVRHTASHCGQFRKTSYTALRYCFMVDTRLDTNKCKVQKQV